MNGEAVRNFAEGLRCSLGQLAGKYQRIAGNEQDSRVARYYEDKAEGVREAIRLVMAQLEERTR